MSEVRSQGADRFSGLNPDSSLREPLTSVPPLGGQGDRDGVRVHSVVVSILEDVAWGAVEGAADGVEGAEAHRLGLAGLEDGEVGDGDAHALAQFVERHLASRHHYIKIYDNHGSLS